MVFAFEHPINNRKEIFPAYKAKRHSKELPPEEFQCLMDFKNQVQQLQKLYLRNIGFRNVFNCEGYESDDILAVLARDISAQGDDAIMITGDNDMLQCINEHVSIYHPTERALKDLGWFQTKFGFHPNKWAMVKAIAGCTTDEVPGIPRVGEKTAIKYVQGRLPTDSNAYRAIKSREGCAIVRRNRVLVELPMIGCPSFDLQEDEISRAGWIRTCDALGMDSIRDRPPVATRKLMSYGKSRKGV
jgi:5'-3' exonuclease